MTPWGDQWWQALGWAFLSFQGRIRRRTYGFSLIILLCVFWFVIAQILVHPAGDDGQTFWGGMLLLILFPAMVCSFALVAKRLHDFGFSGWWSLLAFAPFLALFSDELGGFGSLIVFIGHIALIFVPGEPRSNQYGPSPKAI